MIIGRVNMFSFPAVHPYFLWEIDLALNFGYFDHLNLNT